MKNLAGVGLKNVQEVYSGPEGDLWELIMGQQIHIGGFKSSQDLAERAGIGAGMSGIDLCCCNGAGMRFLVRFRGVRHVHGIDATQQVIDRGRQRTAEEGLSDQIEFTLADVGQTGLFGGEADFVWGEDAWCYVVDKEKLIAEAVRLVKPGGMVAFTDWVEGPGDLTADEARRFMTFMKFPSLASMADYRNLLVQHGCSVRHAEDTGQFAPHLDLYLKMLDMQLTYDALRIIHFDTAMMEALSAEMVFAQQLAHAGKIAQGLFVAVKQ